MNDINLLMKELLAIDTLSINIQQRQVERLKAISGFASRIFDLARNGNNAFTYSDFNDYLQNN